MKKLIFTMAAFFTFTLVTNAQTELNTNKKATKSAQTKETASPDGKASVEVAPTTGKTKAEDPKKVEEPKKSGTRMAINEKGLPGDKKAKKTETANPK